MPSAIKIADSIIKKQLFIAEMNLKSTYFEQNGYSGQIYI